MIKGFVELPKQVYHNGSRYSCPSLFSLDDIARVVECVDDYNYTSIVTNDGKVHTISLRYSQVVGKITDALEKRGVTRGRSMKAAELTAAIPKIRLVDADTGRAYEGYYCEMPETTYCMPGPHIKTVRMILTYTMTDWGLPNAPKLYRIDDEDDVEIIQAEPPKENPDGA